MRRRGAVLILTPRSVGGARHSRCVSSMRRLLTSSIVSDVGSGGVGAADG